MATTPPMLIMSQVDAPPAPRWGPSYSVPRYPTRASLRASSGQSERTVTPEPKRREETRHLNVTPAPKQRPTNFHRHLSPPTSPTRLSTHKRTSRSQVQTLSPTSPESHTRSDLHSDPFTSVISRPSHPSLAAGSWLPTPVKTPQNPRNQPVKNFKSAARVLFQDQIPVAEDIMPSPRKTKRVKKHNGFSLASSGDDGVQIYTDSRDQVPEVDQNKGNPFSEQLEETAVQNPQKRKLRSRGKSDPEVQKAINDNKGIVYTFRGKKFLKKFEDKSDDEDSAADDDGGTSLDGVSPAMRALAKPMSRKSIKPKRLFQTPEQVRQREAEKAEEATTDIEEEGHPDSSPEAKRKTNDGRLSSAEAPAKTLDSLRLGSGDSSRDHAVDETESPSDMSKRGKNFETWKRVKSRPTGPSTPKGRKRSSSTVEEDGGYTKKLRNR